MDERVTPYAQQIGFEADYRAAQDGKLSCRSQAEYPALLDALELDEDPKGTNIRQFNYKKWDWLSVHHLSHRRENATQVLVKNRFLFFIGGEQRASKMVCVPRAVQLYIVFICIFVS